MVYFVDLNTFLGHIKMTYNSLDSVHRAVSKLPLLKKKNQPFSINLKLFPRILRVPHWYVEAMKDQLYKGFSEELKNILSLHILLEGILEALITSCKRLNNIVRAINK